MKPELEALYEGLCRREPALFEPEALHKQIDAIAPAVSGEALEDLLQLCEGWQKHTFAAWIEIMLYTYHLTTLLAQVGAGQSIKLLLGRKI